MRRSRQQRASRARSAKMAGPRPTPAFARTALDLTSIGAGERFFRIYPSRYPDPLGYGKTRSRFSDPRRRADAKRFGVLYLGASLKVCFVEAVLRDRRNGAVGDYPIEEETELARLAYAEIAVAASLNVVDLRRDGPVRMGIPSDVAGASEPWQKSGTRRGRSPFMTTSGRPTGSSTPRGSTRRSAWPSMTG